MQRREKFTRLFGCSASHLASTADNESPQAKLPQLWQACDYNTMRRVFGRSLVAVSCTGVGIEVCAVVALCLLGKVF